MQVIPFLCVFILDGALFGQVQLFPFYGDIPTYGDSPINTRYTIGAKHAYFVDFSSTSQNRKEWLLFI